MQISIETNSKIEDIQELFTTSYPFLKIEFYKLSTNTGLNKKEGLPLNMFLAQAINKELKAAIHITEATTIAELEDSFQDLGVKAEIFRRSGNVWVETSLTGNWTLSQQNLEGEDITRHYLAGK